MTFKHKLSNRLALLRDIALAGTVALAACEVPSRTSLDEAVSKVIVSPETLVVSSNQTTDFVAVALTAAGDTASSGITWTASAGSVTETTTGNGVHKGHYSAPSSPGQYKVKAKANSGSAADSATVTVTSVTVASVSVSPATAAIWIGAAQQFTAATMDSAGNPLAGRVITWSSDNPAVATVGSSGLARGVSAGSATLTATSEGKTAAAPVTVSPVAVAAVTISPSSATIFVGSSAQLTAITQDSAGNPLIGRVVSWASSNPAVATVSGSGLVTAVVLGSATVTATSEGKSSSATITVASVPVASVTVSPTSASIAVGATQQLSAVTKDSAGSSLAGRVVTWASSNAAVATVNSAGLVTGVAAGSATITAASEGKSGTAVITVTIVPVASVTVSPASASLFVGGTRQLSAVTKDAAGNTLTGRVVTWASSNPAVATVNSSGLVTAAGAGSATITATSEGKSGTAAITVTVVPVAAVTVSPASATIAVGGTRQLSAVTKDSAGGTLTGRVVTWSNSNTAVATVNSSGLVTGVAAGSATITATSEGKSSTAAITVIVVPVASVTVSPAAATIVVGGTQQLSAVTKDSAGNTLNGRVVTWSSSNPAVATVSASGLVSGVAAGSASITATSEGKSGSAAGTVQTPPTVSGDTIPLQIVRMDGGSGSALVSNGIPLPKGKITPSNTSHVVLLVGGQEQAIHVEALSGNYPDGSARALLLQFQYTVNTGSPIAALLITGPSVTRTKTDLPKTTVTGNMPAAVALPTSASYLVSTEVVGQTITRAASPASPSAFPTYESQFVTYGNQHWATEAANWTYDYYDRALIWYAWWVRTADPEYWRRGTIDAVAYRQQYVEASNYTMQPHNALLEGLAVHYLLTGDEASRVAVGKVAYLFSWMWTPYINCTQCTANGGEYVEGRIQARTLLSHYLAWMINAVGDQPTNWVSTMATDVTNILSTQQSDGSYRFVEWEMAHSNYMTGMMHDALIKYYTYVQADPRIPPAIKKTLDWMWATQWDPTAQAFKYLDFVTSTGGTTPYPDLNGLIVTGYGWYYQYSGNATYKTEGDAILAGGNAAYLDGYKQFNQSYTQSYRYLFYRQ